MADDGRFRILVTDDDARSRRLFRALLEPEGYVVTEAESGEEALLKLVEASWDLLLLDVNMPGLTGLEVLERIRQRHSAEELPVILVTALDYAFARQEGLALQANDFVTKPVDRAELLARIKGLLILRRALAELNGQRTEIEETRGARTFLAGGLASETSRSLSVALTELALAINEAGPEPGILRERLEASLGAVQEASAIVEDAGRLARMSDSRRKGSLAEADLEAVLPQRLEGVREFAKQRELSLTMGPGTGMPPITCDPALLLCAMDHLLLAAVTHSPRGARVDLSILNGEETERVRVEIRMPAGWNGPAEPEEGTGLGLCQLILGRMGGYLKLLVSPETGVVLAVSLPTRPREMPAGFPGGGAMFAPGSDPV